MALLPAEATALNSGFSYDGGALFVPPGREAAVAAIVAAPGWQDSAAKAALVAYAADRRWRLEVGGILVGSVPVATDDRSKLMITGARVAAMADPGWSTVWHGADGATYPVDAAAMVAISDAVQAHVNAGFATFAAIKAAIEAGTISTMAEIDAAFAAGSAPG
ncbi:MAG: hypothetical protein DI527_02055 [Chelatococcus sp.]|nr:MAG: hypothetical protein DI527_02055 [Chelatococcus sp.]